MADVNRGNRPLSPRLTIYRPQMTSISSIFVRITGNALLVPGLLLVSWFLAAATGPAAFSFVDGLLTSVWGDLLMAGSVWAAWFHLLGGLRHLIWDTGRGLDVPTAEKMGWGMVIGSVVLTVLSLLLIS